MRPVSLIEIDDAPQATQGIFQSFHDTRQQWIAKCMDTMRTIWPVFLDCKDSLAY
jgi:hypothetical protein